MKKGFLVFFLLGFSILVFASEDSSKAYGGGGKGLLWSEVETQNIWRNPSYINQMKGFLQLSRTGLGPGYAKGGLFLKRETLEKYLGTPFPGHLGLYVNHNFYALGPIADHIGFDFGDFDNFTGKRIFADGSSRSKRLDFFLGGLGDTYNLAFRLGYEFLRLNSDNASAIPNKYESALDFSVGLSLSGFDIYVSYGFDGRTEYSENHIRDNKSSQIYYEIGLKRKISEYMVYANFEKGDWSTRQIGLETQPNVLLQLGIARTYKTKKSGEIFADLRFRHINNEALQGFVDTFFPSSGVSVNSAFMGNDLTCNLGFKEKLFSWLEVAASIRLPLYEQFEKAYDGDYKRTKMNLGLFYHFGSFQLDTTASFAGSVADLGALASSSSGTLTYTF